MVHYDFDRPILRTGTDSVKWDLRKEVFGRADVIPMWVADMDFAVAEPITEALRRRTEHPVYGYTRVPNTLLKAIIARLKRKYSWKVQPEWLVFTPGVIPAIAAAVRAYTHPGDAVVMADPVYHPFWSVVPDAGCRISASPLKLTDGRYEMDFDDLRQRFKAGDNPFRPGPPARAMILCNPHNPVGREWSRPELIEAGRIAIDAGAVVISDEIHCELLFDGVQHTPFAAISEEFARNSLVCLSATKTFNLAGLAASVIVIPDVRLRTEFQRARGSLMPQPDVMALAALEAAYNYGDEWLAQLSAYLQGNLDYLMNFAAQRIPRLKVIRPEGTYLVWLDCRALGLDKQQLRDFFITQAGVGLDDGNAFGPGGAGFQRMNIACTRATLVEALERIELAVNQLDW
ncbi:MAG: PatB family C-S lyase [Dehalogenimonas sp.]|uniref:cysteine-S-conjugate beta-lyase n=1 Tax=Candidatus Dehalogenimonas loeffleri TaxID=3127115 RepID=A0ABZ2J617_9CHLR|nr:PatB family C-S lyase [Dehalogenimonas sp.]